MKKLLALIICLTIATPAFSDDWEDWSEYADYDEEEIIYEEPIISEPSEPASTSIKSNHDTYLGVRLYKNESIKFDFKPFESSNSTFYDEDIAFGLVFGNRLTDYVKIELESAYLGTSFQKNSNEFNYDIWSNMLNVYLFKEYGGAVAPYFGLGIGASAIWSAAYSAGDFRMDMSWQALVGINFALNQRIDLNLGLKYQDYGYAEHKNNAGNYAETSIYGLQLYLGAAYKFSL